MVPWARLAAAFAAVPVVLAALVLSDTALAQVSGAVTPGTEVFRIQTKEKVVALTFDDAWVEADLQSILATLKDNGIKATFFPTGVGVQSSPALAQQIAAQGHEFGSHSYTHSKLETMKPAVLVSQVQMTEEVFASVGLPDPAPLFRAPWGEVNSTVLEVLGGEGYTNMMWTARGGDTVAHRSAAQVVVNIMKDVKPGAIILLHTGNDVAPKALPELIRRLKAAGYGFVTLREALLSPEQQKLLYQQSSPLLAFVGAWSTKYSPLEAGGSAKEADFEGAAVLASFTGTTFELLAPTGPGRGKASVVIDGGAPQVADLFSATEQHRVTVFAASNLADTTHTALISWTGTKNEASAGYGVSVDAVRVSGKLTPPLTPAAYLLSRIIVLLLTPFGQ